MDRQIRAEDALAVLVVEQRAERQPVPERDVGGDRPLVVRQQLTDEEPLRLRARDGGAALPAVHSRVAHEVGGEPCRGIDVGTHRDLLEVGADGEPGAVVLVDGARDLVADPEIEDLVRIVGDRESDTPAEVFAVEGQGVEEDLVARVLDLAEVDELVADEAARRCDRLGHDRVLGALVVPRELEVQPVVEGARIESQLDLGAPLGTEFGVAHELWPDRGATPRSRDRLIRAEGREGVWLLP